MNEEDKTTNSNDTGSEQLADSELPEEIKGNEIKRDSKGRLLPGTKGISPGRPKGITLKQWARERFLNMTWDEKKAFIDACPPDLVWKMAEGMPPQDIRHQGDSENPISIELSEIIAKKQKLYDTPQGTE